RRRPHLDRSLVTTIGRDRPPQRRPGNRAKANNAKIIPTIGPHRLKLARSRASQTAAPSANGNTTAAAASSPPAPRERSPALVLPPGTSPSSPFSLSWGERQPALGLHPGRRGAECPAPVRPDRDRTEQRLLKLLARERAARTGWACGFRCPPGRQHAGIQMVAGNLEAP